MHHFNSYLFMLMSHNSMYIYMNCILRTHFAAAALDQLFISRTRTLKFLPDIEALGSTVIVGEW